MKGDSKLTIWAVSDGRAGIENQALGLAEAFARIVPAEISVKRVAWKGPLGRLPTPILDHLPIDLLTDDGDPIAPPWPDLWIAAGRASLPLSLRLRTWSGGRTFVVQLQDPRVTASRFDLVIPPEHDGLEGANVFSILGSPHRVTPERLMAEAARIPAFPVGPKVAVLIGGRSRHFDLPDERAKSMAAEIGAALKRSGAGSLVTFSRRTPKGAQKILMDGLGKQPGWWSLFADGRGEHNPYFAYLQAADAILVTEDSINMAAEAASTGKPVHILSMEGGSPRIARFHAALRSRGAARPFEGAIESWDYEPLRETERAAAEVVRRLKLR